LAAGIFRQRQHHVGALDATEFIEDGARAVTQAGTALPLLQRLPQDVGQKAHQDIGTAWTFLARAMAWGQHAVDRLSLDMCVCADAGRGGFVWDQRKARINLPSHGVDFADAATVFETDHALTLADEATQKSGTSHRHRCPGRVLIVAYTMWGKQMGFIEARRAMKRQRAECAHALRVGA
jgi:uncharacterized DUF497 family protein